MTAITLEAIKADQCRLAERIAAIEAQQGRTVIVPRCEIRLASGEYYAGIITRKDDARPHHVILLPGDDQFPTWSAAKDWAAKQGGELPSRREQALLYANLKEQFQPTWYWSSEPYASDADCAWYQDFEGGDQDYYSVDGKRRARAVRRLVIE